MFKTMVLLLACFSASAVDLKPFLSQIEAAKSELIEKEKAARAKLLDGLKREEKAAQSSGKLDFLLMIQARIAELGGAESPFGDKGVEAFSSNPVSGSASEKIYANELTIASGIVSKKMLSIYPQLDQKKLAATKAGKIDDALAYEEVMVQVKDFLATVDSRLPSSNAFGQFEGKWIVTFKNGVKKTYSFSSTGDVECSIPHLGKTEKYKLRSEKGVYLCNVEGSRVESFSINNSGKLLVSHYESEIMLQEKKPVTSGMGEKR